ncbi:hypothetical protein PV04_06797 [Phialophora macrospora]|uniref:Uncharacterized protein n=1 Tax=Phialophora macrospora TaxID=1851006 RepID=A0A0D2FHP8_9EURO|nr:hypothetical protein PV04_06797 [Phialophora macrospora]
MCQSYIQGLEVLDAWLIPLCSTARQGVLVLICLRKSGAHVTRIYPFNGDKGMQIRRTRRTRQLSCETTVLLLPLYMHSPVGRSFWHWALVSLVPSLLLLINKHSYDAQSGYLWASEIVSMNRHVSFNQS